MNIGISLGWNCSPAMYGVSVGLRGMKSNGYQTCPFDEMVSNYPGIVECIRDDFKYFMDENYLEVREAPFSTGGIVKGEKLIFNTKYNFFFNHESPGHADLYKSQNWIGGINHYIENNYALLKERYNRRVESFRKYIQEGYNGNEITFIVFRYNDNVESLVRVFDEKYPNLNCKLFVKNPPESIEMVYQHHILMGVNEEISREEVTIQNK